MIGMIFVVGATVAVLVGLGFIFVHRHASRTEEARRALETEVARLRATDAGIAEEFVAALDGGRNIEQALPEAHRAWQQLLPRARSSEPWNWSEEDLDAWAADELARRHESISRGLLLRAVLSMLGVLVVGGTVLLLLWNHEQPRSIDRVPAALPAASAPADEDADTDADADAGTSPAGKTK